MPLYLFTCATCSKDMELLIGMHEAPVCPVCGDPNLRKKITGFAFRSASGVITGAEMSSDRVGGDKAPPAAVSGHRCDAGCSHGKSPVKSDCSVESTNKLIERHLGK